MKNKSSQETNEKLNEHYVESSPSFNILRVVSTRDTERSKRLFEVTSTEIINITSWLGDDDRRMKMRWKCYFAPQVNLQYRYCITPNWSITWSVIWCVPRTVHRYLHRTFVNVSLLWMKHLLTITRIRSKNSKNNGASARKFVATVSWDYQGEICVYYDRRTFCIIFGLFTNKKSTTGPPNVIWSSCFTITWIISPQNF